MKAFIIAVAILATGCATGVHTASAKTQSAPTTTPAPLNTVPSLSTRLVLGSSTVNAGCRLSGTVMIENNTGHAIRATGCGSIFEVLLTSSTYQPPAPPWPDCAQLFTIPNGESGLPVTLLASYIPCAQGGPGGGLPACGPAGPRPLVVGAYEARTFEIGNAVPIPAEVPVTVTAPTT